LLVTLPEFYFVGLGVGLLIVVMMVVRRRREILADFRALAYLLWRAA